MRAVRQLPFSGRPGGRGPYDARPARARLHASDRAAHGRAARPDDPAQAARRVSRRAGRARGSGVSGRRQGDRSRARGGRRPGAGRRLADRRRPRAARRRGEWRLGARDRARRRPRLRRARSRRTSRTASSPKPSIAGCSASSSPTFPAGTAGSSRRAITSTSGVGGWEREGPRLRRAPARFCREYGIPESSLEDVRGHRLPLVHPRARLAKGRVALLGDAAGLVDPLSGDGIYEAFLSARLATEAVLAGDLESYDRELRRTISSQLAAGWSAKVALDRFPRLTYAVVRTPFLWNAVVSLIGGDVPSPSSMRGLRRVSMRRSTRSPASRATPARRTARARPSGRLNSGRR